MSELSPRAELPSEGYVRIDTVLSVIPVSRATWYEGVKDGFYPKPVKLTKKAQAAAWRVADIRELIARIDAQGEEL